MDIILTGELTCRTEAEMDVVRDQLPRHVELTRAEPGCLEFEVLPVADSLNWKVRERFIGEAAFRAHQQRVASSAWGRATAGIERRYEVQGLAGAGAHTLTVRLGS